MKRIIIVVIGLIITSGCVCPPGPPVYSGYANTGSPVSYNCNQNIAVPAPGYAPRVSWLPLVRIFPWFGYHGGHHRGHPVKHHGWHHGGHPVKHHGGPR